MFDDVCRLSVSLTPVPPLVRISVSDTGTGSTLEEFQRFKYLNDPIVACKWDGVLCIVTTSISDEEIHLLKFDWKEVPTRRLVRLPSITKNGAKFSGTQVSLSLSEEMASLVTMISEFIQKVLLLKAPKIAVEFSVGSGGSVESQSKSIVLQNSGSTIPVHAPNIENLKLGLEDYVSKHGNRLLEACHHCFSTGKNLKIGTGTACSQGKRKGGEQVMEVVIIVSEIPIANQSSCFRLYGQKTEVLYFRDFLPCLASQSSLDALMNFDWKNYGMVLKSVGDQDGVTLLEWENLPPGYHIDIVLHRAMIPPLTQSNTRDKLLTRKAVKLALNELKERNAGVILSQRAAKICSYAPDLAKTISGLLLSSHDTNFQRECLSLLGLEFEENGRDVVENCIKEKIISVVERNDRNPKGTKEAPLLFVDDGH